MGTCSQASSQPQAASRRLRNAAIGALFVLVLLVPKVLDLRRKANSWMLFRILLGVAGAALVVVPLSLWNSYLLSLVGLVLFIVSILLPPAKPEISVDDKARELGALVVVNGGRYQPENSTAAAVQFFIGAERIWALDTHFQPVLAIPVSEITSARAEESEQQWLLHIRWADHTAEFSYRGIFSEHLARVAESTLHGVMRPSLPVIPQRRAASA